MPETTINISEKMQKISETAQDYKDALMEQFKDLDVNVKNWNFAIGKIEDEYNVEINVKLGLKSKNGSKSAKT